MSAIVTFYSYKGGVGRTMALANIAVLLVRQGLKVLAVDWDLEAPGLERYFRDFSIESQYQQAGLLDLLNDAITMAHSDQKPDWKQYLSQINLPAHRSFLRFGDKQPLTIMTSGRKDKGYVKRVLDFHWDEFFETYHGGAFIESLREDWLDNFDIVLIDSRTGITDSGGICTIQIPDILVLVFTANAQSLLGVKDIALRAQAVRQKLPYDRMPLLVFPLPSRYDGRTEYAEGQHWMTTFAEELAPFYDDWLPQSLQPLDVLEKTKLPYVAYFSFGEKLPVILEGTSDPQSLGYAYAISADLIGSEFSTHQVENLQLLENGIKPSNLHEQQVEALGQIYEALADCQDAISDYISQVQKKVPKKKLANYQEKIADKAAKWDKAVHDFKTLVDRKDIYLPSQILTTLQELIDNLAESRVFRNQGIKDYILKSKLLPSQDIQTLIDILDNVISLRSTLKREFSSSL